MMGWGLYLKLRTFKESNFRSVLMFRGSSLLDRIRASFFSERSVHICILFGCLIWLGGCAVNSTSLSSVITRRFIDTSARFVSAHRYMRAAWLNECIMLLNYANRRHDEATETITTQRRDASRRKSSLMCPYATRCYQRRPKLLLKPKS